MYSKTCTVDYEVHVPIDILVDMAHLQYNLAYFYLFAKNKI